MSSSKNDSDATPAPAAPSKVVDMSTFFGTDGDECPICLEPMPALSYGVMGRKRHPCCGQWTCITCSDKMQKLTALQTVAKRHGKEQTDDDDDATCCKKKSSPRKTGAKKKQPNTKKQQQEEPSEEQQQSEQSTICLFPCHLCRARIPPSKTPNFFHLLLQKAEEGHAWAQYAIGKKYSSGECVKKSSAEAARWYRKAAEQGHPWAQSLLGACLEKKSPVEARLWYEKSAEAGHPYGQFRLGSLLSRDGIQGVTEEDKEEAVRLFRLSADKGVVGAMRALGDCHAKGNGVPRDLDRALHWFNMAAENGNAVAMNSVARTMLENAQEKYGTYGLDITGKCPIPRALRWLHRSVAHGYNEAAFFAADLENVLKTKCANCRRTPQSACGGKPLMKCVKCRCFSYCSKQCQVQHWRAGHKRDCCDRSGKNDSVNVMLKEMHANSPKRPSHSEVISFYPGDKGMVSMVSEAFAGQDWK